MTASATRVVSEKRSCLTRLLTSQFEVNLRDADFFPSHSVNHDWFDTFDFGTHRAGQGLVIWHEDCRVFKQPFLDLCILLCSLGLILGRSRRVEHLVEFCIGLTSRIPSSRAAVYLVQHLCSWSLSPTIDKGGFFHPNVIPETARISHSYRYPDTSVLHLVLVRSHKFNHVYFDIAGVNLDINSVRVSGFGKQLLRTLRIFRAVTIPSIRISRPNWSVTCNDTTTNTENSISNHLSVSGDSQCLAHSGITKRLSIHSEVNRIPISRWNTLQSEFGFVTEHRR